MKQTTALWLAMTILGLSACDVAATSIPTPIQNHQVETAAWQNKWRVLEQERSGVFRIVQIGDSHTAGDFFSDEVRTRLQQRLGNAGIGWVAPARVAGQRAASVRYDAVGGSIRSSRKDSAVFPFGGIVFSGAGSEVKIQAASGEIGEQNISLSLRSVFGEGQVIVRDFKGEQVIEANPSGDWQYVHTKAMLPFTYVLPHDGLWEIGQIGIENGQSGITYSSMGINGSQLSHWNKWRVDWTDDLLQMKPDLVVLAYGTNEAFNPQLNVEQTEKEWHEIIQSIKKTVPEAGIVIVGAPESLKAKNGTCGVRPEKLTQVQEMQQRIAQAEQIMFWSWQDSMGGICSMKSYMAQGLAAKDGVHFNAKGYRQNGADFAQALIQEALK